VSIFGKRAKLRKVLRLTGIHPAQAILIGDEIRDIEAARDAGIASGAVTWGFTDLDTLKAHSPDMLFESVDEILLGPGLDRFYPVFLNSSDRTL